MEKQQKWGVTAGDGRVWGAQSYRVKQLRVRLQN